MKYLIIGFMLIVISGCECDTTAYRCTPEQLTMVEREVAICTSDGTSSHNATYYCLSNAKKTYCGEKTAGTDGNLR